MKKYRIVRDNYCGYEVQYRTRFWPFWRQAAKRGGWGCNTNTSIEEAELLIESHRNKGTIKEYD